jgi:hypothetical protein
MKKNIKKWQFGDFQTPESLAAEVLKILKKSIKYPQSLF